MLTQDRSDATVYANRFVNAPTAHYNRGANDPGGSKHYSYSVRRGT